MIHLCLQQFRIDIIVSLKNILPEHEDTAKAGGHVLTYWYLEDITGEPPQPVSGNRTEIKEPAVLVEYLVGINDSHSREH